MASRAWVAHCAELLSPLGTVRARRLFGGHGLYLDDLFVALIVGERLYLKTDAGTRPRFQAAGGEPFVHAGAGRPVTLGYWTVPPDAMESPALMQPWARMALQAALEARAAARPAAGTAARRSVKPRKRGRSGPARSAAGRWTR